MAKDNNNNSALPVDKINQLAEILKAQELTEIELESDGLKIKVRKEITAIAAAPSLSTVSPSSAPTASAALPSNNFIEIKSPMVGTFYASASPGAAPFVKAGDQVKKGDTLCIVEAMKLMNELPSEHNGEVVEVCVNNGDAISYGQVIMKLKP